MQRVKRTIQLLSTFAAVSLFAACGDNAQTMDMAMPDMAMPDLVPLAPVKIQLVDISDWHGQLDPVSVSVNNVNVDVGGAAVLAGYFKQERAANPNTLIFTGGDEFGASPALSSFFNEEPAVKALNLMGLDASTFGNHNFDRGITHLQSMIDLAKFKYVSSNFDNLSANLKNVAAPYHMFTVGGTVKVAVLGLTLPEAPQSVFPGNFGTIMIREPVAAATAAAAQARMAGAHVVVVIAHMGAIGRDMAMNPVGPLIDFGKMVQGVDVVFGDHTDILVNTKFGNTIVVENRSKGVTYARVSLTVDPNGAGKITESKVDIVDPYRCKPMSNPCEPAVTPDQAVVDMLAPYRTDLAKQLDTKIAVASDVFVRGNNVERLKEMPIGNLLADAMRDKYKAQVAFMNGGGIRAPIPSDYKPTDTTLRRTTMGYAMGPPYDVVIGDVFQVLPFGNIAVTRSITGKQLWQVMERSVSMVPNAFGGYLQISGFKVTYKLSAMAGMRVQSIALDDGTMVPNDETKMYTTVTTDFTNAGGDGYTMLADGQGTTREKLDQVLLEYIKAKMTITPATSMRINEIP